MQKVFEKIIERLEEYPTYSFGVSLLNTEEYIKVSDLVEIVNQVAKEYGGGWIPVSSGKLPEYSDIYEVTARGSTGVNYTEFAYYYKSRDEWWKYDDAEMVNVLAWKKHTELYKAESEE